MVTAVNKIFDGRHGGCHDAAMVSDIEDQIAEIDKWLAQSKWKPATLGTVASGNAHAISRIRTGAAPINTLSRILEYIRKNEPPTRRTAE